MPVNEMKMRWLSIFFFYLDKTTHKTNTQTNRHAHAQLSTKTDAEWT